MGNTSEPDDNGTTGDPQTVQPAQRIFTPEPQKAKADTPKAGFLTPRDVRDALDEDGADGARLPVTHRPEFKGRAKATVADWHRDTAGEASTTPRYGTPVRDDAITAVDTSLNRRDAVASGISMYGGGPAGAGGVPSTSRGTEYAARASASNYADSASSGVTYNGLTAWGIAAGIISFGAGVALVAVESLRGQLLFVIGTFVGALLAVGIGHLGLAASSRGQTDGSAKSVMAALLGYCGLLAAGIAVMALGAPAKFPAPAGLVTGPSLAVGDCVADPLATLEALGYTDPTYYFEKVDCSQPHFGEVYLVNTNPDYDQPGFGEITASLSDPEQECADAFASYVGLEPHQSLLWYETYYPVDVAWDAAAWNLCMVTSGEVASGTLAGSNR